MHDLSAMSRTLPVATIFVLFGASACASETLETEPPGVDPDLAIHEGLDQQLDACDLQAPCDEWQSFGPSLAPGEGMSCALQRILDGEAFRFTRRGGADGGALCGGRSTYSFGAGGDVYVTSADDTVCDDVYVVDTRDTLRCRRTEDRATLEQCLAELADPTSTPSNSVPGGACYGEDAIVTDCAPVDVVTCPQ